MRDTFVPIGEVAAGVVGKLRAGHIERIPVVGRESWLAMRRQDVTASAAAALLGIHPYVTGYALWALKSGKIEEDGEESAAMLRGRLLEPVAVQLLREKRPDWQLHEYPLNIYFRDPAARIGATPDLLGHDEIGRKIVIQIKTVEPSVFRRDWRDPDNGEHRPPLWIAVQAIIDAALSGAERAAVAALVVGYGVDLHVVDVPIHAGIMERVRTEVAKFWRLVESGKSPDPDYARDGETISRLFGQDNGAEIDLSGDNRIVELLAEREAHKSNGDLAKATIEAIDAEIKSKMGAAATALLPGYRVSLKTQNRKAYTVAATSFRALRITKTENREQAA